MKLSNSNPKSTNKIYFWRRTHYSLHRIITNLTRPTCWIRWAQKVECPDLVTRPVWPILHCPLTFTGSIPTAKVLEKIPSKWIATCPQVNNYLSVQTDSFLSAANNWRYFLFHWLQEPHSLDTTQKQRRALAIAQIPDVTANQSRTRHRQDKLRLWHKFLQIVGSQLK